MEDITITGQQVCDAAKLALDKAPSALQSGLKAACDKACESPCELPAVADPASGFDKERTLLQDERYHRVIK